FYAYELNGNELAENKIVDDDYVHTVPSGDPVKTFQSPEKQTNTIRLSDSEPLKEDPAQAEVIEAGIPEIIAVDDEIIETVNTGTTIAIIETQTFETPDLETTDPPAQNQNNENEVAAITGDENETYPVEVPESIAPEETPEEVKPVPEVPLYETAQAEPAQTETPIPTAETEVPYTALSEDETSQVPVSEAGTSDEAVEKIIPSIESPVYEVVQNETIESEEPSSEIVYKEVAEIEPSIEKITEVGYEAQPVIAENEEIVNETSVAEAFKTGSPVIETAQIQTIETELPIETIKNEAVENNLIVNETSSDEPVELKPVENEITQAEAIESNAMQLSTESEVVEFSEKEPDVVPEVKQLNEITGIENPAVTIVVDTTSPAENFQLILAEENTDIIEMEAQPASPDSIKSFETIPVQTPSGTRKFIISGTILFSFESYRLSSTAMSMLDTLYTLMKEKPELKVEITGYTDSKGPAEYNLRLSKKRSDEVINYLVKRGIDRSSLSSKGAGETNFIAINTNPDGSDNPEGRKYNRRAEISLLNNVDESVIVEALHVPEHLRFIYPGEISPAPGEFNSFADKKSSSTSMSPGKKVYTIQLLAMSKPVREDFFDPSEKVTRIQGEDGLYRYISGTYNSISEAKTEIGIFKEMGFWDAFIRVVPLEI
ncbi:MAG: OmpA family protein, partial [Bacteroidales bacterium]|nr:OmpA family protein [Bacteroidales bacterium]